MDRESTTKSEVELLVATVKEARARVSQEFDAIYARLTRISESVTGREIPPKREKPIDWKKEMSTWFSE